MASNQIFNKRSLKGFRKHLRKNLTPSEAVLWNCLKGKKLGDRKFRRQHSIGKYVADFYSPSEKLVVELDGKEHFTIEGSEYDLKRDKYMNSLGIKVLRFENRDVNYSLDGVLEEIKDNFKSRPLCPLGTSP